MQPVRFLEGSNNFLVQFRGAIFIWTPSLTLLLQWVTFSQTICFSFCFYCSLQMTVFLDWQFLPCWNPTSETETGDHLVILWTAETSFRMRCEIFVTLFLIVAVVTFFFIPSYLSAVIQLHNIAFNQISDISKFSFLVNVIVVLFHLFSPPATGFSFGVICLDILQVLY